MRACPPVVRIFAACLALHCGKDPILEAAENLEEETTAAPGAPPVPAQGEPMPVGEAGEPEPGIPEEPEPAPAGTKEQPEPPPPLPRCRQTRRTQAWRQKSPNLHRPDRPVVQIIQKEGGVQQEGPQVLLRGVIGGSATGQIDPHRFVRW